MVENLDESFQKFLEELSIKNSMTVDRIVRILGHSEIDNREKWYPQIKESLMSEPIILEKFSEAIKNSWATGDRYFAIRFGEFIKKPTRSTTAIIALIRNFPESSHEIIDRINEFVNTAVDLGFEGPDGTRDEAGAALLASVILTSCYPDKFADYRKNRWEQFAKACGVAFPSDRRDHGSLILWVGDFTKILSNTQTFRRFWTGHEYYNWAISGICWAIKDGGVMIVDSSRFIIANITWNESGWRSVYIDPKAGHRYAREHPGHESLNFKFDKNGLDTENNVFGYVQWVGSPKKLEKDAAIFFYTKNLNNQQNEIVGIYGNVEILKPSISTPWNGFENNVLMSNIRANQELSLLFSIPLDANKYSGGERLVPQAGFKYVDDDLATRIITDQIELVKKSGVTKVEYQKLVKIYEFITKEKFDTHVDYIKKLEDEDEQEELEEKIKIALKTDPGFKNKIIYELKSMTPLSPEIVEFHGKSYKRDNYTIELLKKVRDFKCQLCHKTIMKKDGNLYIEAAHIIDKSQGGPETPENILILCPNHHKEFDFGNRKIIVHNKNEIIFEMNGQEHRVDLSIPDILT